MSREELRTVVAEAGALLPGRNREMLVSVLDLERVTVDDIMVPRNEIIGIDLDDEWDEILGVGLGSTVTLEVLEGYLIVLDQLDAADQEQAHRNYDYELPPLDLLLESDNVSYEAHEREVRQKARLLEKTFQNFGFKKGCL